MMLLKWEVLEAVHQLAHRSVIRRLASKAVLHLHYRPLQIDVMIIMSIA